MLALHKSDLKIAANDLSEICRIASFIMLVPLIVTFMYLGNLEPLQILEKIWAFVAPSLLFYLLYIGLAGIKSDARPRTKHTMITVSLAWLIIALVGFLPYLLNGTLSPLDSFFESMSGWTTTGMTLIKVPENVDRDVLFYRALTQWVGGVGIIVLALVVFLRKGTFAMDYYASEVGEQKIKPRLKDTIHETWKIYIVYTIACIILLYIVGMDIFDAVAHAFSAMSTGGFSSHTDNIGYYNSHPNGFMIQVILLVFMIIGAISFLVHFKLFEGEYKRVLQNIELNYMFRILSIATLITFLSLYFINPGNTANKVMDSIFHTIAAMTCTGFSITDLSTWPDLPQTILMVLMYIGGLYGSTAGGIKILRLILIVQVILISMKKLMLPKTAVLRMKIRGKQIKGNEILYVFGLTSLYLIVAFLGASVLMTSGYTGTQSMFLSLSAMGNVGLTDVSGDLWFGMHTIDKITLTSLMWIGRLEVFPVLVLFYSIIYKGKSRKK